MAAETHFWLQRWPAGGRVSSLLQSSKEDYAWPAYCLKSLGSWDTRSEVSLCAVRWNQRPGAVYLGVYLCLHTSAHMCVCVSLKHHLEASKLLFKPETQGRRCSLRTYIVSEEKKGEWNWGAREGWDPIRALLLHLNDLQAFKTTTGSASVAEWLAHSCQSVGRVRHQELLAYENRVVKTQLLRSVHPTCFSSCFAHFLLKDQGIRRLRRAESEQRRSHHQNINRRH